QLDPADGEVATLLAGIAELEVHEVGEDAVAPVVGVESAHEREIQLLEDLAHVDVDRRAAGVRGHVRVAAQRGQVDVEAGAELPPSCAGVGRHRLGCGEGRGTTCQNAGQQQD